MTTIETIVIMIVAIISLPLLCSFINRPSLLYSSYLLLGLTFGHSLGACTHFMLEELGKVGFIILLFLIGLEIEIPSVDSLKKSLPFCLSWFFIQIPLLAILSWCFGLGWGFGFIAAAGISACSLSLAYGLLKGQSHLISIQTQKEFLTEMVFLEVVALFMLAASEAVFEYGWKIQVLWQGIALLSFILILRLFSGMIYRQLSNLIESSNKWRIHLLFLIIFLFAIVGERIGLSAPKTAFFLGLFMSSITHKGLKFEEELKPIAHRILIPVFFISLGSSISIFALFPYILPLAGLLTLGVFFIRFLIFRYTSTHSTPLKYFLLYCPNLTMVAVAAEILIRHDVPKAQIDLLLAIGLLMTVGPAFLFPTNLSNETKNASNIFKFSKNLSSPPTI